MRDQTGITKCVMPKPLITIEVTNSGTGTVSFASWADTVRLSAVDTLMIHTQKRTEKNSEYPDFETNAKAYGTLVAAVGGTPATPPTPGVSGAAACPVIGIVSVGYAGTSEFTVTQKYDEGDVVLTAAGLFAGQDFFDPTYEFSVSGVGSFPALLELSGDGELSGTEFGAGVTMILSITESQSNSGEPTWEASGQNWPHAA